MIMKIKKIIKKNKNALYVNSVVLWWKGRIKYERKARNKIVDMLFKKNNEKPVNNKKGK